MGAKDRERTPAVAAVMLDALGTLLDLPAPWGALVSELHERFGVAVEIADARRALTVEMAHYRAHNHTAHDPAGLARLRRECAAVLGRELDEEIGHIPVEELVPALMGALRFEPFGEVAATLRELRGMGVRVAVVSNWDISLGEVLERTGLAALVDVVVTSAATGAAKPDRRVFDVALERLAAPAVAALHVGDSYEHDVLGARAAGVRAVLVARPRQAGTSVAGRATRADVAAARRDGVAVIDGLDALPGLIARR